MVQALGSWWPSLRNFFILFFAIGKLAAQEAVTTDQYVEGLHRVLLEQGAPAADLYMRQYAEAGLDLTPLRQIILGENGGKPKKVEVRIHPLNTEMLGFMQEQMERSKIDFVELVPVIDETLPSPDKPFKADEASYARWTKYRMGFVSILSFITVMATGILPDYLGGGAEAVESMKVITYAIQGLFVIGVEVLTSKFSSALNIALWSPKRFQEIRENQDSGKKLKERLVQFFDGLGKLFYTSPLKSVPGMAGIMGRDLADTLRDLSQVSNRVLIDSVKNKRVNEGKPFLTAGFYYINLFNFTYATAIFAAGYAASYFTGVQWDTFGHMLMPTAMSTLGFYFALAMNQNLIGRLLSYGQIREFMRLKIELTSLYLAKPGRIIATMPGYQYVGITMQVLSGLVGTVPSIFKVLGLERYARTTGQIYDENARLAKEGKLVYKPFVFTGPEPAPNTGNLATRLMKGCAWLLKGGHLNSGAVAR